MGGGGEVLGLYLGPSGTEIRRTQEGCHGVLTNNPLQKVGTMFGVVSTQGSGKVCLSWCQRTRISSFSYTSKRDYYSQHLNFPELIIRIAVALTAPKLLQTYRMQLQWLVEYLMMTKLEVIKSAISITAP